MLSTGTVNRFITYNSNHHYLQLIIMTPNVMNYQLEVRFSIPTQKYTSNTYHKVCISHISIDTFHSESLSPVQQYEIHCFIYLVAKSDEAPSHLFPAWAASGPDWHGYGFELPAGLWMFVQQTDSHLRLQAPEETPPPSANQITKHLTVTVLLCCVTSHMRKLNRFTSAGVS